MPNKYIESKLISHTCFNYAIVSRDLCLWYRLQSNFRLNKKLVQTNVVVTNFHSSSKHFHRIFARVITMLKLFENTPCSAANDTQQQQQLLCRRCARVPGRDVWVSSDQWKRSGRPWTGGRAAGGAYSRAGRGDRGGAQRGKRGGISRAGRCTMTKTVHTFYDIERKKKPRNDKTCADRQVLVRTVTAMYFKYRVTTPLTKNKSNPSKCVLHPILPWYWNMMYYIYIHIWVVFISQTRNNLFYIFWVINYTIEICVNQLIFDRKAARHRPPRKSYNYFYCAIAVYAVAVVTAVYTTRISKHFRHVPSLVWCVGFFYRISETLGVLKHNNSVRKVCAHTIRGVCRN